MKKIIFALTLALTLSGVLASTALADFVYITKNGTLGRIEVTNKDGEGILADIKPLKNTGVTNGGLLAFRQYGITYALITESNLEQDDYANVYNVGTLDQNTDVEPSIITLEGIQGACAVAEAENEPDSTVFIMGRNSGAVVEFKNREEGWPVRHSYNPKVNMNLTGTVTGVDVLIYGAHVYSLFGHGNENGKLVLSDGLLASGDQIVSYDVSPNPTGMVVTSTNSVAISYHGKNDGETKGGGIDLFERNATTSLLSRDLGPIEAIASDGNEGFYFVEVNSDNAKTTLHRWMKDGTVSRNVSNLTYGGESVKLVWDSSSKVLAALSGNNIVLINNDGQMKSLTSSEFGDNGPISIAEAYNFEEQKDDSSGCNVGVGFVGLALLGLLGVCHRKD